MGRLFRDGCTAFVALPSPPWGRLAPIVIGSYPGAPEGQAYA